MAELGYMIVPSPRTLRRKRAEEGTAETGWSAANFQQLLYAGAMLGLAAWESNRTFFFFFPPPGLRSRRALDLAEIIIPDQLLDYVDVGGLVWDEVKIAQGLVYRRREEGDVFIGFVDSNDLDDELARQVPSVSAWVCCAHVTIALGH
jgi:hypothetical protein